MITVYWCDGKKLWRGELDEIVYRLFLHLDWHKTVKWIEIEGFEEFKF